MALVALAWSKAPSRCARSTGYDPCHPNKAGDFYVVLGINSLITFREANTSHCRQCKHLDIIRPAIEFISSSLDSSSPEPLTHDDKPSQQQITGMGSSMPRPVAIGRHRYANPQEQSMQPTKLFLSALNHFSTAGHSIVDSSSRSAATSTVDAYPTTCNRPSRKEPGRDQSARSNSVQSIRGVSKVYPAFFWTLTREARSKSHSDRPTPKANADSASRKQHTCSDCMQPHHHRLCIKSPKACSILGCTTRRGSNCSASAPNLRSPSVEDNTQSSQHSKTPFLSVHLTSTSSFLGSQAAHQI